MAINRMYCIEGRRSPADLGFSIILVATDKPSAIAEAKRLYPEYVRDGASGRIFEVSHVNVDWEAGRTLIIRRHVRRLKIKLLRPEPLGEVKGE